MRKRWGKRNMLNPRARSEKPADPGSLPRVSRGNRQPRARKLEATRRRRRESPMREEKPPDGCQTDPEPGMDSRRATVRNMRSKCRCSCVLQFTFRRAVSCVLHRPPSQVIHCIVLCFSDIVSCERSSLGKRQNPTTFPSRGAHFQNPGEGEDPYGG